MDGARGRTLVVPTAARRYLGGLEVLDQGVVAEEVALGGRQARQQVILERLERDLELVLLPRQVRLQLLEVRTFLCHDVGQQLVLQAVPRHREVDQRRLSLSQHHSVDITFVLAWVSQLMG